MNNMKRFLLSSILLGVVAIGTSQIENAFAITMTFEGVGNKVSINDFYNGGTDNAGHSGPNYGINFSSNSRGLIASDSGGSGNFIGALSPSPFTLAYLDSGSTATMNVAAGFNTNFSFFYDAPIVGDISVNVYDATGGGAGSGNLLASLLLPQTGEGYPGKLWFPVEITFDETAYSADFVGIAAQFAIDDISLVPNPPGGAPVPEPSTLFLLGVGLCGMAIWMRKRTS